MNKPKHSDYCTHIKNPEDRDILKRKLFDVNLRLMESSPEYAKIVKACADYILWNQVTEKEGYTKPRGFSGANAGIPFNIIAVGGEVMINPRIVDWSPGNYTTAESNCGSLTLPDPILIRRHSRVEVTYIKPSGHGPIRRFGYFPTVQHEVDHNNGILITDRTP